MMLQQHYYTSYYDPTDRRGGFRTKAMSSGLSPELETAVKARIGFMLPSNLDEDDISNHPVAFRYCHLEGEIFTLINSVSCAKDESHRGGNFFAHSLVGPRTSFESTPPILYYQHPIWVKSDPESRKELPEIPKLAQLPPPEFASIQYLLESRERLEWFQQLIAAMVHVSSTHRRIVILAPSDQVAMWIQALTLALPPCLRSYLTFDTYQYDVYNSNALVTGTMAGTSFTGSDLENRQFSIFDPTHQRVNDISSSVYAQYVAERCTADRYHELDPLFEFTARHLPTGSGIDDSLDKLAETFALLIRDSPTSLTSNELATLNALVSDLAQIDQPDQDDLTDLALVANLLRSTLISRLEPNPIELYRRVTQIAVQADPLWSLGLGDDLKLLINHIHEPELATQFLSILQEVYGAESVLQGLLEKNTFQTLVGEARSIPSVTDVWTVFGSLLPFDRRTSSLWLATIDVLEHSTDRGFLPPEHIRSLIGFLIRPLRGSRVSFVELVSLFDSPSTSHILPWFYYELVSHLPIPERSPLRAAFAPLSNNLLVYEFDRDLDATPIEKSIELFATWNYSMADDAQWPSTNAAKTYDRLWRDLPDRSKTEWARYLLSIDDFSGYLSHDRIKTLLISAFGDLPIAPLPEAQHSLTKRYLSHPANPIALRERMEICMDLANGTITPVAMQRLHEQLRGIDDKEYSHAITTILSTQLQLDSPIQRYELLFKGTYVESRLETFWAAHSQFLIETIAGVSGKRIAAKLGFRGKGDAGRARAKAEWLISLLQFWFVDAVFAFKELGFPAQEFFFFLPTVLGELKRTSDWPDMVSHLDRLSQDRPWRHSLLLQLGLSPSGARTGSTKR